MFMVETRIMTFFYDKLFKVIDKSKEESLLLKGDIQEAVIARDFYDKCRQRHVKKHEKNDYKFLGNEGFYRCLVPEKPR